MSENEYRCTLCNKIFKLQSSLKKHEKQHEGVKYTCDECSKSYTASYSLLVHKRTHTGEKPYACSLCPATFSSSGHRLRHERSCKGHKSKGQTLSDKTPSNENKEEKESGAKSTQRTTVSTENKVDENKHEGVKDGEKPYTCSLCPATFSSSGRRLRHERSCKGHNSKGQTLSDKTPSNENKAETESGAKWIQRTSVSTDNKVDENEHEGVKDEEKPYTCSLCPATFSSSGHRLRHERSCKGHNSKGQTLSDKTSSNENKAEAESGAKSTQRTTVSTENKVDENKHEGVKDEEKPYTCSTSSAGHRLRHERSCKGRTSKGQKLSNKTPSNENKAEKESHAQHRQRAKVSTKTKVQEKTHEGVTYFCDKCGKFFTTSYSLLVHKRTHTGEKPYPCSLCPATFSCSGHRLRHERSCKCRTLSDVTPSNENKAETESDSPLRQRAKVSIKYKLHKKKRKGMKYTCDECSKSYTASYSLLVHKRTHTGEKPYPCSVCPATFSSSGHRLRHERSCKRSKGLTPSNENKAKESSVKRRRRTTVKVYCKLCHKVFSSMSTFRVHKDKHMGRHYYCSKCPRSFTSRDANKQHEAAHGGERPWKCSLCNSSFTRRSHLNRHNKVHAGKREHMCEICGKTFILRESLQHHMLSHTRPRPYPCDMCGHYYQNKTSLKNHMKIHTNQRDFTCEICHRDFIQKQTYRDHMKVHDNDFIQKKALFKPFTEFCTFCYKGFANSTGLRRHLRKHELGTLKSFNKLKKDILNNLLMHSSSKTSCNDANMKLTKITANKSFKSGGSKMVNPVFSGRNNIDWNKYFTKLPRHTDMLNTDEPEIKLEVNSCEISAMEKNDINDQEKRCDKSKDKCSMLDSNTKQDCIDSVGDNVLCDSVEPLKVNLEDGVLCDPVEHAIDGIVESTTFSDSVEHPMSKNLESTVLCNKVKCDKDVCVDVLCDKRKRNKDGGVHDTSVTHNMDGNVASTVLCDKRKRDKDGGVHDSSVTHNMDGNVASAVLCDKVKRDKDGGVHDSSVTHNVDCNMESTVQCDQMEHKDGGGMDIVQCENANHDADDNFDDSVLCDNVKKTGLCEKGSRCGSETDSSPVFATTHTKSGHEALYPDITDGQNQDITDGQNQDITDGRNQDITDGQNQDITGQNKDITDGQNQDITDGRNQDITDGQNQDITDGQKQDITDGRNQDITDGRNQDITDGRNQDITDGRNQDITDGQNQEVTDGRNQSSVKINNSKCKKKYKCYICWSKFQLLSSLKYHTTMAHKTGIQFICKTCRQSFCTRVLLQKHVRLCPKLLACTHCGMKFTSKLESLVHLKWSHSSQKSKSMKKERANVDVEIAKSCNIESRKEKEIIKLDRKAKLGCEKCGRLFKNDNTIQYHKTLNHCTDQFECNFCNHFFESQLKLASHVETTHDHDGRPYKCKLCSKAFAATSGLNKHKKKHKNGSASLTVDRDYMCTRCGKCYSTSDALNRHMLIHEQPKPYPCYQCEMAFTQKNHLTRHVNVRHENRRDAVCTLNGCGKAFPDKFRLRDHIRTHTKERPYQCDHCHKNFSTASILKTHIKSQHQKLREFLCHICFQDFSVKHSLQKHLERHMAQDKLNPSSQNFVPGYTTKVRNVTKMKQKSFSCENCKKLFTTKRGLVAHQRSRCSNTVGLPKQ